MLVLNVESSPPDGDCNLFLWSTLCQSFSGSVVGSNGSRPCFVKISSMPGSPLTSPERGTSDS